MEQSEAFGSPSALLFWPFFKKKCKKVNFFLRFFWR